MAIAYATEAHLFITDVNQSPFNVGTRLTVEDFTLSQVADLNERYSVYSVAFSPDGKRLATGSFDGTVKPRDAATEQEVLSQSKQ